MPFASSLSRKQTGYLSWWVVFSSLISSTWWQQLIGFDIVELQQILGFALLSGFDDNYYWKLQCIYFRFHFQRYPQWNIIVWVTGWTGSESSRWQICLRHIYFLISSFPHRKKTWVFLIRHIEYIESRGIQLIHAKRLTHNPNTYSCVRYTLLVMDSWSCSITKTNSFWNNTAVFLYFISFCQLFTLVRSIVLNFTSCNAYWKLRYCKKFKD